MQPELPPVAGRTYPTAPYPCVKRHFGRTSSVRLRGDCDRLRAQHGSIRLRAEMTLPQQQSKRPGAQPANTWMN